MFLVGVNKFRVGTELRKGHGCSPGSEVWAPFSHLKDTTT